VPALLERGGLEASHEHAQVEETPPLRTVRWVVQRMRRVRSRRRSVRPLRPLKRNPTMPKWVNPNSRFATGSSTARVSQNLGSQRDTADRAARQTADNARRANPKSRADKNVRKGGRG
jgi:hypothetical protein